MSFNSITGKTDKPRSYWFTDYGFVAFLSIMMFLITLTFVMIPDLKRDTRVCNRAFVQFQSATNIVDLERAKFVLRRMDCLIADRLDAHHP